MDQGADWHVQNGLKKRTQTKAVRCYPKELVVRLAVRARVGHARTIGNAELLKGPRRPALRQQALMLLGRPMVLDESCSGRLEPRRAYLIAGHATVKGDGGGRRLNPTIVVPWPAAAKVSDPLSDSPIPRTFYSLVCQQVRL